MHCGRGRGSNQGPAGAADRDNRDDRDQAEHAGAGDDSAGLQLERRGDRAGDDDADTLPGDEPGGGEAAP